MGYAMPGMMPRDPRTPARRAAITMIITGLFGMICGGVFSLIGYMPAAQYSEIMKQAVQQHPEFGQVSATQVQASARATGTTMGLLCLAQVVVAIPLFGGSRRTASIGIALAGLALVMIVVAAILHPDAIGNMMCADLIFLVLMGAPLPFLVQAYVAAPHVAQYSAMHQAQYAQFLQQQMAYHQQYGFNPMAMAPPPPGTAAPIAPVYGANAYNAPATGAAPAQTGWQWPPPPPGAAAPPPPPAGDSQDVQGPQA